MRKLKALHHSLPALGICALFLATTSDAHAQTVYQTSPQVPIGFNQACAGPYAVNAAKAGALNVRSGPGTKYAVTGRLFANQVVNIMDCRGNWLGIRDPQTTEQIGWIHKGYTHRL